MTPRDVIAAHATTTREKMLRAVDGYDEASLTKAQMVDDLSKHLVSFALDIFEFAVDLTLSTDGEYQPDELLRIEIELVPDEDGD